MSSAPHDRARQGDAQRWASIVVGAAVIGVVGWMTYEAESARPRAARPAVEADASTAVAAATAAPPEEDAGATSSDDLDAGLFLPSLSLGDAAVLPSSAPRNVKIGVVLVTFAGAEGAAANARSKKDALALAERLGADARNDFHQAVTAGDPGSSDNIGQMPRGVLDARTELSVFALAPGEVSEVLETTRGYWVVKRLE
ncbi:MAG: peptidylprolyl isomerase [Labilithrix sp.]|nr:peptidylprolyl isomerase [Labilithrix sp.]MCW5832965.1 peptidylprolyl isomerase [Labilithrix sp.]